MHSDLERWYFDGYILMMTVESAQSAQGRILLGLDIALGSCARPLPLKKEPFNNGESTIQHATLMRRMVRAARIESQLDH